MPRDVRTTTTDRPSRRRYTRVLVPVGIAGIAAATAGLVPALASSGDPDLPKISAQKLIEKIADAKTDTMSGTVKSDIDLGLPSLPGGTESGGSSADPQSKLLKLASGSNTFQVAQDGPEKSSIALIEKGAEYRFVHNGDKLYAYDSKSNTAWRSTAPKADGKAGDKAGRDHKSLAEDAPKTPQEAAEQALDMLGETTKVSVDGTSSVAGRDAYDLALAPKDSGSTIGQVRIAVDSKTGVPLKVTVQPRNGGGTVVDIGYTKVSFGTPAVRYFDTTPPAGTKVTDGDKEAGKGEKGSKSHPKKGDAAAKDDVKSFGKGWTTVLRLGLPDGALKEKAAGKDAEELKKNDLPNSLGGIADLLGSEAKGEFGTGTVIKSKLINALVTDDGKIYVGAVSTGDLIKAANADK